LHIAAVNPTQLLQPLAKRRDTSFTFQVIGGEGQQGVNRSSPDGLDRLRTGRERPTDRCAAKKRDEFAPTHAIPRRINQWAKAAL
jgi:hypothetical protein